MTTEIVGLIGIVSAATITGVFAVLAARFRKENMDEHQSNHQRLSAIGREIGEIKNDVREVRSSQHRHLEWHAEGN